MPRDYRAEILAYEEIREKELDVLQESIKGSEAPSAVTDQLLLLLKRYYG